LRSRSVSSVVVPAVPAAGEVFAPGHLGELTRYVPVELVDAVLEETGTVQQRLRCLPSRVGIYFVLALGLFPHLGYARVWDKLVAGLAGLRVPVPSEKALRDLRRRLGPAPLKALFEVVAGPLAQPRTPGVCYRRWRTVAFDGCNSLKVPDADRNRGWLGRAKLHLGWASYPTLRLMTLVETGSRGVLGACFGPKRHGENHYARRLLHLLGPDQLVLADRGFDDGRFLAQIAGTGAQFLVRLTSLWRLPTGDRLPDGSGGADSSGRAAQQAEQPAQGHRPPPVCGPVPRHRRSDPRPAGRPGRRSAAATPAASPARGTDTRPAADTPQPGTAGPAPGPAPCRSVPAPRRPSRTGQHASTRRDGRARTPLQQQQPHER
jgi:hypothetical protein